MHNADFPFEIIEDEPVKPKRKPKRKYRPLFGYMPWRQLGLIAISGITIGLLLALVFTRVFPRPVSSATLPTQPAATNHYPSPRVGRSDNDVAFLRDELVAVGDSQGVRLYDASTRSFPLSATARKLAFSHDGLLLAVLAPTKPEEKVGFANLQIWDVNNDFLMSEMEIFTGETPGLQTDTAVAFSADSGYLAVGGAEGISIRNAYFLEREFTINTGSRGTSALAFSQDRSRLTAIVHYNTLATPVSGQETLVQVWDIQDTTAPYLLMSLPIDDDYARWATISASGRYLAYTSPDAADPSRDSVHIFDLINLREIGTIPFQAGRRISTMAVDDNTLAVTERTNISSQDRYQLRAVRWKVGNNGFEYELLPGSQTVGKLGAAHFHLWDDSRGLDYVELESGSLLHWSFG